MEELSYVLTKDFVSWVHVSFYFFTYAHFHLAVRYEMFKFFFQRNSSPLFPITRSSSFSVIHVSVNIKNNVEKDTTLLFFPLSKSLGDSSCIWVAIPVNWVILYWCACGANGHVTTEISQTHRLPNFLTYGAPLHALRARELRYNLNEHTRRQKQAAWSTQLWSESATTVDYYERNEGPDQAAL